MRMRTIAVMFIALFVGGCAWVGGGKNKSAENFDLATTQRAHWQQLAEQDDAEAEYQLGLSYCCGFDSSRTQTTARAWLCKAALQGHAGAQFQLGQLFGFRMKTRPMSLPGYTDYAHFWYSLAAAQGHDLANTYRYAIEQDMSEQQLARSHDWQGTPRDAGC